ncbi:MAG: alpha/beta fold hydrolase [Candidatus Bathyarchaeia archaeon]
MLPTAQILDKWTRWSGEDVHFLETGQGPTIITLHGAGRPASLRAPIRRRNMIKLAGYGYRVVSPDLPGFGLSPMPTTLNSLGDYTEFLANFADGQGIRDFYLIGTSMGGAIASLAALAAPNRVRKLVLIGSAGLVLADSPIKFSADENPESSARRIFYNQKVADLYILSGGASNTVDEDKNFRLTISKLFSEGLTHLGSRLSSLTTPTLIVWGAHDEVIPVAHGHEMNKLIPNSSFVIIPETGHLPQVEEPDKVYGLVTRFLNEQSLSLSDNTTAT